MQIHAIQTGTVRVRSLHRHMAGAKFLRFLGLLTDRDWTEPLPIFTWVIEHPEGLIVIDTGETARVFDPGHFGDAATTFFYKNYVQFDIDPAREIGPQMENLGLNTADVRWVVLSHLHSDHVGGVYHFPSAEIVIARAEMMQPIGAASRSFPRWFKPRLITYDRQPVGPFDESYALTEAEDVVILPTPGHTPGHQSVLLRDGELSYLFAGDATFSADQLVEGGIPGITFNVEQGQTSNARLRGYIEQHPTVYLPAHDPDAAQRLEARAVTRIG